MKFTTGILFAVLLFLLTAGNFFSQSVPATPTLSSPANNSIKNSRNSPLTWNAAAGAATYTVRLSYSSDFSMYSDYPRRTTTSIQFIPWGYYVTVYWKVRAENGADTSAWSETWNFRTVLGPPQLKTPLNGALGQLTNLPFTWWNAPGAESYRLQISKNSDFTAAAIDQSGITLASYTALGLNDSTLYYWRINSSNVDETSEWSETRTFSTNLNSSYNPPTATYIISPPNNSTGLSPISQGITWHTSPGAVKYEFQSSRNSDFREYRSNITGSYFADTAIAFNGGGGIWYFRIRAINYAGASNWSETWSLTYVPVSAQLIQPLYDEVDVPPNVTFKWEKTEGATHYRLRLDTDVNKLNNPKYSQVVFDTTYSINNLNYNTKYTWVVDALDGNEKGVETGPYFSFTTMNGPPTSPSLSTPNNNSTGVSTSTTLQWNSSAGALTYHLQISTSLNFNSTVYDQAAITTTSTPISGLNNSTIYYWRVNAVNNFGTSDWSNVWSFTTQTAGTVPESPILSTPFNGATNVSVSSILNWNSSFGADSYRLQVSTNSNFNTIVFDKSEITNTSQQLTGLSISSTYYWRVNAANNFGTSDWSNVWSFTTQAAGTVPESPILSTPFNGATNVSVSSILNWNSSLGADSYRLQVSTNSNFNTTVFDQSGITSTSQQLTGLSISSTYYWRVNAANNFGTSDWSAVWSFTTQVSGSTPEKPTLLTPANASANVSTSPVIIWNESTGADSYRLQVSTNSDFTSNVFDQSGIINTSVQVTGLHYSASYFIRVNAANIYGISSWSDVWHFSTTSAETIPNKPLLSSPSGGLTNISTEPVLSWYGVAEASSYRLQLSENSNFSPTIFDQSGITQTSQKITGLRKSTIYYWRVNATNNAGTSDWSSTWSFTTQLSIPTPQLLFPSNNSNDIVINPTTFLWKGSKGVKSFMIIVAVDSQLTSVKKAIELTDTVLSTYGLVNGTTYFWIIKSTDENNNSIWSETWKFTTQTTGGVNPGVPLLLSPPSETVDNTVAPLFSWKASENAEHYRLQISTKTSFANPIYDINNIENTSIQVTGLNYSTKYYWRLTAVNKHGSSSWTNAWEFTTRALNISLKTPLLVSPPNGILDVNTKPLILIWNKSEGTEFYELEMSIEKNFSNLYANPNLKDTSWTVMLFSESDDMLFYWRVRGKNYNPYEGQYTYSNYSETWSFRTAGKTTPISDMKGNIPSNFYLYPNFPNPFNPTTTIKYTVPLRGFVTLTIYDLFGRVVKRLVNDEISPGIYEITFSGENLSSGVYYCKLTAAGYSSTIKLLLLK